MKRYTIVAVTLLVPSSRATPYTGRLLLHRAGCHGLGKLWVF
jgi:hypothetical protein